MLRVENLGKTFSIESGKVQALQQVSLEITDGEFFTLLGPSGSGKSTTLRCVAGLEHAEDGEIFIGEECVFSARKRISIPPEQRPIGMVFQSYAIWPHMDVFDNVAFPLRYGSKDGRQSKAEIEKNVIEALKMVQMGGLERRPATQLSGGQQQRVALARALVRKPKLLLLDEPLSNLDAKLREEMRVELKELTHSLGITSFFVTHDQIEALAMSNRIGVIIAGVLVESGTPYEMYVRPKSKVVAEFLGTANSLDGRVVRSGPQGVVETEIGPINLDLGDLSSNEAVAVVIRPEGIVCSLGRPDTYENLFEGTVQRAIFLGTFIDSLIQIKNRTLRVFLSPYNVFLAGQRVYVDIPRSHCQVAR